MKKQNMVLKVLLVFGVLAPSLSVAHHYKQTTGYQNLLQWSHSMNGRDYNTDPAFQPYCNEYANVSVRQANQRVHKQCQNAIPLTNDSIKKRWSNNQWGHKGWCLSVSSHASRQELINRENGLKKCLTYHAPANNNAQIRKNCIAGDNIHKQASRGNINYVKSCLDAGVNPNVREGNQWTPLHSAARSGRLVMVKMLLQRGSQVNARDINGRTPLAQAVAGNYPAVQNYLKQWGGI
ncbi:MAG: ankyrin repeat domain-containing protein [Thiolinea sp.]